MTKSQELLKKYFGYETFRKGQEEIIDHILEGQDCLGIMPTGAGKSICYQIPAMILPRSYTSNFSTYFSYERSS